MATQVTLNSGSVDSAGSLALKTNGTTTAVTINASQGVEFNAGTAAAPSITTTGDTNTGIFFPAADTIAFSEGGAESMRIDSSGNVGIGTTSPAGRLDVTTANTNDDGLYLTADGTSFGYASNITFRSKLTSGGSIGVAAKIRSELSTSNNAGLLFFTTASGTNAEKMRLDASGSLGIGVTSPNNTLAVGISAANSGIDLESISNGGTFARFGLVGPFGTDNDTYIGSISNNNFLFYTNNTERARITSGGNLLLGTTTDNARFAVSAPTATTSNRVAIFSSTSASDNGNECIATVKTSTSTTTDNTFLKFYIGGGASGSGQINANGASAAAFGTLSDSRIKENIVDLPSQLDNIMALRPVEYDYIESEGGGHQIGFVAQEVQPIYPDLVGERQDGMLTLTDLNKNDARLIKAIQELKAIVDAQAVEIAALKGTP